jgi:acetylglutamate kinase
MYNHLLIIKALEEGMDYVSITSGNRNHPLIKELELAKKEVKKHI